MAKEEQGQPQPIFDNFGEALKYYRETIADRIRRYVPGRLPVLQLSAKDVVACMKGSGYSISQAAYSDIEQGQYLPRDPGRFMAAVVPCLALEQGGLDYLTLMDHLLFDMVDQRLGPEVAELYRKDIRAIRVSMQRPPVPDTP